MKYLKYIAAVSALLGIVHITYSAELTVNEITPVNANTINVSLSENPNLAVGELDAEIRVLNDMKIRAGIPLEGEFNKIELLLEDPILPNTNYSLLTVLGADGSIDFETPSSIEGYTSNNISSIELQDIESIEIIDDRTIIVQYREDIGDGEFEYKLLAESSIVKIEKLDYYLSDIQITIDPPLISEKDYILMFIEMRDEAGEYLEFDTGIYDFTTPIIEEVENQVVEVNDSVIEVEEVGNDTTDENTELDVVVVEEITEENKHEEEIEDLVENEIELNAAGDEISLEKDSDQEISTLEAASQITQTPNTGAETWVLVIATLLINSFYYLSRRKAKLATA